MKSLGDLLKGHERRLPFRQSLRASRVCQAARQWIVATWGQEVMELVALCTFREGVLSVGVSSSPFAEELRLREQELRSSVRAAAPKEPVAHIRIFVSG